MEGVRKGSEVGPIGFIRRVFLSHCQSPGGMVVGGHGGVLASSGWFCMHGGCAGGVETRLKTRVKIAISRYVRVAKPKNKKLSYW